MVIDWKGLRFVVSGDYKRAHDPTCAAFEPVRADVFVTEATFALPVFAHPPAEREIARLLASLEQFGERTHLVGAYSLGKAQRVIALLRQAGYREPVVIHPALEKLCALYAAHGVELGPLEKLADTDAAGGTAGDLAGRVVVAPPGGNRFGARASLRRPAGSLRVRVDAHPATREAARGGTAAGDLRPRRLERTD